ncbi:hypothetical protein DFH06DRAFT_1196448, partial [Mycena polygramma]
MSALVCALTYACCPRRLPVYVTIPLMLPSHAYTCPTDWYTLTLGGLTMLNGSHTGLLSWSPHPVGNHRSSAAPPLSRVPPAASAHVRPTTPLHIRVSSVETIAPRPHFSPAHDKTASMRLPAVRRVGTDTVLVLALLAPSMKRALAVAPATS